MWVDSTQVTIRVGGIHTGGESGLNPGYNSCVNKAHGYSAGGGVCVPVADTGGFVRVRTNPPFFPSDQLTFPLFHAQCYWSR